MATDISSVKVTPRALLQQRDFLFLLSGQFISAFGDKIHYIALGVLVFRLTGSPLEVGKMALAGLLPYLLFGLVAGVYVDRWNKKTTMILSDLLRACLVFLIPWALAVDFNLAYLITFLVTTLSLFFNPAKMAVIPTLFSQEKILPATSLAESVENVTEVLGYALAGLITATVNLKLIFFIDAGTFLFSALTISALSASFAPVSAQKNRVPILADIKEGLNFIRFTPALKDTLLVYCSALIVFSGFSPLVFVYALGSLQVSTLGLGILEAFQAIGLTFGGVILSFLSSNISSNIRKGMLIATGFLISGFSITLLGVYPYYPLALICFLFAGISNAMFLIPVVSIFQEVTPQDMRGRVFSARFVSTRIALMLSIVTLTFLTKVIGVNAVYSGIGLALIAVALVSLNLKSLKAL